MQSETSILWVSLALFAVTYVCLLVFPKIRAYIALGSAAVFVVLGILPIGEVLPAVDWNVLLMIVGTMGTVFLFIESKMPAKLADIIIDRMPNVKWVVISLALFAGIISAFVDNVATVLMVAPVAVTICKKLNISPVTSIIAIAISSNLQGAATLVGDTTSILLGSALDMSFVDFFWYKGRLGMFFVVELAAVVSTLVLMWVFRKDKQKVEITDKTTVTDFFPSFLLVGTILALIAASFVPSGSKPAVTNGLICVAFFVIGLLYNLMIKRDKMIIKRSLKDIDYFTVLLLAGLFIVIAGVKSVGVIDQVGALFVNISGGNVFVIYTLIVWVSVALSAVIDNIPYIATMIPVVAVIAPSLGIDPVLLYFGLLSGATLGGNITPIGASANIAGLGILRKEGYEVKAGTFMKISVPFTLAAVVTGYLLVWLIWA